VAPERAAPVVPLRPVLRRLANPIKRLIVIFKPAVLRPPTMLRTAGGPDM